MKKLGWIAAILAVVAAGAWLLLRERAAKDPAKYRTEVAERGDVTMTVTATGTISAVTTVQVGSQVSGIIAKLYADFNSRVGRGQLLAELDPTPFEARVEQRRADVLQAEVQMRRAKLDFDRQQRLLHESLSSQAEFDGAQASYDATKAQVDQAQAALRQALTDLQYTKIVSPIEGVVVARQYDVGQTVAASFQAPTLFTIAQDLTKMQVQADVDQSDIGRVAVGQSARFNVDAYPDEEFHATISQIRLNASVNQNVITYPVILAVPNPDDKLRPQMTADVNIDVAKVADVLRVPNAALRFRPLDAAAPDQRPAGGGAAPAPRAAASADSSPGSPAGSDGSTGPRGNPAAVAHDGDGERAARQKAKHRQRGEGGRSAGEHPGQATAEERPGGGFGGAAAALDAATGSAPQTGRPQAIYLLDLSGKPRRIPVRVGISDGKFTQIVGGEVAEGDPVIVGLVTARGDSTQLPPGAGGGGGGRGMGRGRAF